MKMLAVVAMVFGVAVGSAQAAEPDGLILPAGFHATVVADHLGSIRHLTVRGNGDIYVSTRHGRDQPSLGIIALRLGPDGKAVEVEHFSGVDQGTGIRISNGGLYAASGTGIYRFALESSALVPVQPPETVVSGLAISNHAIAFDGKGNLYVSLDGGGNTCTDPGTPKGTRPIGLTPCPNLVIKGGIWRFDASKSGQTFGDGEHYATGIRNMSALDWRPDDGLYGAVHGRDGAHATFPEIVSAADDDAIADEMFRISKGTDMGWPYTYYDGARKLRLIAPEYNGDGKTPANGKYAIPVAAFQPLRPAVLDLVFYNKNQFPAMYRGGAFLAMHGGADAGPRANGEAGYNIVFLPFHGNKAGSPIVFADGFAGSLPKDKDIRNAVYRPVGLAVGPDGKLYVADSNKGRIWRISYGDKPN